MAQVDGFSFEVEGFAEVQKALQHIETDIMKKRELVKILRRQATPALEAMKRNAPEIKANKKGIKRGVKYHRDDSTIYWPGNLKRSMKLFSRTKGNYPRVFVGAQAKKARNSGYYGYFVPYGTKGKGGIKKTNDFRQKSESQVRTVIETQLEDKTYKYIKRKFASEFTI